MRAGARLLPASLLGLALAWTQIGPAAAQSGAGSDALPACHPATPSADACLLPAWPTDGEAALPSVFGSIDPEDGIWVTDPGGDAPAAAPDITGVGIATIDIEHARALRGSDEVLVRGDARKVLRDGEALLVRTVLAAPLDSVADGHAAVLVATDGDGTRTNDAPTETGRPDGPFAGLQDVASLHHVADGDVTRVLQSDLARGWYKGKEAFAAARPAPTVIDVLLRIRDVGDAVRVVSFASGDDGGYDVVTVGPGAAAIPVDGRVGPLPVCLEAAIIAEPYTVRRLEESGQTVRDIEARASWAGGGAFTLGAADRDALEALLAERDPDADGHVALPSTATLISEGLNVRQRPEVEVGLDGDRLSIALQLGLPRRGYHVLRDIALRPTGVDAADAALERLTVALVEAIPPFRSGRRGGVVLGDATGSCLPTSGLPTSGPPEPTDDVAEPTDDVAEPTDHVAEPTDGPAASDA